MFPFSVAGAAGGALPGRRAPTLVDAAEPHRFPTLPTSPRVARPGEYARLSNTGTVLSATSRRGSPRCNLDIVTVDQLVDVLAAYRGPLLVVSHDRRFLERLGSTGTLRLDERGVLRAET